jgi:hypothetical protein
MCLATVPLADADNPHSQGLDYMRIRVKIGYAIVAATYLVTILSILFGCHPFHKNWQIYPAPSSVCPHEIIWQSH